jgi:hypothetical protein
MISAILYCKIEGAGIEISADEYAHYHMLADMKCL